MEYAGYKELESLKEQLNFDGYDELKASTGFERWLSQTKKTRTWHKIQSISKLLPKCRRFLYMTQQMTTINFFNEIFSGNDWCCIQERSQDRPPNWIEERYRKNCLASQFHQNGYRYWNDGRIWEPGMVTLNVGLLNRRQWSPDFIFCDMGIYDDDCNFEKKQLPVKKAEMDLSLQVLTLGGTLVMRLDGVSEKETRELITQLVSCFNNYQLFKATGSNPLNSEVYCICYNLVSRTPSTDEQLASRVEDDCRKEVERQMKEIKNFLAYRDQVISSILSSSHG